MSFEVSRSGKVEDIFHLAIAGQLDAHTYPQFKAEIESLLAEGENKILLDCQGLEYISSAGLGVLKQARKEFERRGGDLRLVRVPGKITNVLDLLGFSKFVKSYKTLEDAVASFKGDASPLSNPGVQ